MNINVMCVLVVDLKSFNVPKSGLRIAIIIYENVFGLEWYFLWIMPYNNDFNAQNTYM